MKQILQEYKERLLKMVTLTKNNDNQQFISIQATDTDVMRNHLVSVYPEIKKGIYGMDNEEILINLYDSVNSFYTFSGNDLVRTVKKTDRNAVISHIIGDSDLNTNREHLRYL